MSSAAQAEGRVLRFISDVKIGSDSSVEVVESVVVRSGSLASHQISRNFPNLYEAHAGSSARTGFQWKGATFDGVKTPAFIDSYQSGVRVIVGERYKLVRPGLHRFVLNYRMTNRIDRLKDFDELYWNATGGDWTSPVDRVEVKIHQRIPMGFQWSDAHIEYRGSSAPDVRSVSGPGEIVFRSTRPLQPNESLIVAVGIPKGFIRTRPQPNIARNWPAAPPIIGLLSLLGLLVFYLGAWLRVGRHRLRPGAVVPIYSPPDDLSPAAMRYLVTGKCDHRTVAAALVDLAVRGHVDLDRRHDPGMFRDILTVRRRFCDEPAPVEELAMLDELAIPGQTVTIGSESFPQLCNAKDELNEFLKRNYQKALFEPTWKFAVAGAMLFLGTLWLISATMIASFGKWDTQVVGFGLATFAASAILAHSRLPRSRVGVAAHTVVLFVLGTLTSAFALFMVPAALNTGWWQPLAIPMLALPLVVSGFHWMRTPTRRGREMLDHIAGFKAYLSRAEYERLEQMAGFKDKRGEFERDLPYAIALGIANHWADAFESAVKEAGSILGPYYAPSISSVLEAIKYAAGVRPTASGSRPA